MTGFLAQAGIDAYRLAFQVSPIFMSGGIATAVPGKLLPLAVILDGLTMVNGLISGGGPSSLTEFFATFVPVPGTTLIETDIGTYPFANQTVAANAIIDNPLHISLKMICPASGVAGISSKVATMMLLKTTLDAHKQNGGLYSVLTPSYLYENCILTRLADVSSGATRQDQYEWQWDFVQPLVTQAAAQAAQNNLISKISSGAQTSGGWGG